MDSIALDKHKNVIEVKFGDIQHSFELDAKTDVELYDDPLNELLTEFDDLDSQAEEYGQNLDPVIVSTQDSALEMSNKILGQISQIKEDVSRLKYYLGEVHLD